MQLELSTVLILFLGGIVSSILIVLLIYFLLRCLKKKVILRDMDPRMDSIPDTLETGRSTGRTSRRVFSSRGKKGSKIMTKFQKTGFKTSNPGFENSQGKEHTGFTVTTTIENLDYSPSHTRMTSQPLELEDSFNERGEDAKNYKLKLELSSFKDESYTLDSNISNMKSPDVGRKIMMEFTKEDNKNMEKMLEDIEETGE